MNRTDYVALSLILRDLRDAVTNARRLAQFPPETGGLAPHALHAKLKGQVKSIARDLSGITEHVATREAMSWGDREHAARHEPNAYIVVPVDVAEDLAPDSTPWRPYWHAGR